MKEISLEELKQLQLDILCSVDKFCRERGIQYTLYFGTLLGAIRHKGYIPWDDDIDIAMTRANYDVFINSFNGYDDNLRVFSPELDYNYYAPYANVCDIRTLLIEESMDHNRQEIGVKIDVFPLDGVQNEIEYIKRRKKCSWYNLILGNKRKKLAIIWKENKVRFVKCLVKKILFSFLPYSSLQKQIHKTSIKESNGLTPYLSDIVFMGSRPSTEFEKNTVRIIADYDLYLKKVYNDYMQLPPKEQRIPHHGFTAYWKN